MKFIVTSILAATMLSACAATNLSKVDREEVTVTKQIGNYSAIDAATGVRVIYTQGPVTPAVIKAPRYILDYLDVKVKGETLKINLTNEFFETFHSMNENVTVTVSAPAIDEFEASSGASITVSGPVSASNGLEVSTSSGASIKLASATVSGKAEVETSSGSSITIGTLTTGKLEIDASSGSSINLGNVKCRQAECDLSSGAECTVAGVTGSLEVDASSGSSFNGRKFRSTTANIDSTSGASVHFNSQTAKIDDNLTGSATNHR